MRPLRFILLLFTVACGGGTDIPIELVGDEFVLLGYTKDELFTVELRSPSPGEPLSIEADADRPIFTFVLRPEDFVAPDGSPVALDAVVAKLRGAEDASAGACGRCLVPARSAPATVNPGDNCALAPFIDAAVWTPVGGALSCAAGTGSSICDEGGTATQDMIAEVRRSTRLLWPGACACVETAADFKLEQLNILPISPLTNPRPLKAFAQDAQGRIAGFSRDVAMLFDPAAGANVREFPPFAGEVRTAVAHKGGGFLVASAAFNSGWNPRVVFHKYEVEGERLSAPTQLGGGGGPRPIKMLYLADPEESDFPLYLLGNRETSLAQLEPALFACNDESLNCTSVSLSSCQDKSALVNLEDLKMLPDGTGIAQANSALYIKAANPPPEMNPLPSDDWSCYQNSDRFEWANPDDPEADEPVRVKRFYALANVGQRVFVCGLSETAPCTPDYAVVLTATVSTAPGTAPEPDWKIVHRGGDWSRCRNFLGAPAPDQIRLQLSSERLIDFDGDGRVIQQTNIGDAYGSIEGFSALSMLPEGSLLGRGRENRIFVRAPGGTFDQVYGPDARLASTYRGITVLADGRFLLLGHSGGLGLLDPADAANARVVAVADPGGAIEAGDRLNAAAVDSSAAGSVLVVGKRGDEPLVLKLTIEGETITTATRITAPAELDDLSVLGVAETAPGDFVATTEGTQLIRVKGEQARVLQIDFDDPVTPELESRPVLSPSSCSGQVPRLNAFRAIDGGHGAAWVVGSHGMVFRVSQDKVERYAAPLPITVTAVRSGCPDTPVFAGRGTITDPGGFTQLRMGFFTGEPKDTSPSRQTDPNRLDPPGFEEAAEGALFLRQIGEDDLVATNIAEIITGIPRTVLRDSRQAGGGLSTPPFALALEGGLVHRVLSQASLEHLKVPFSVLSAAQAPDGTVLFGGNDSHLALGIPQGN